jgi:serine/threonine protein kinase
MTIRVSCPNPDCGAVANVEEQSLGRRGKCKKCGHVFALARPDGEAASAISGDASAWKRDSEPASPTNLPEQFGRYRIMKQLGQGGMGAVYLAFDTKLEREVALKVPYFSPADGPQAVQRFEREARAAATLDHPNLCPIHDVGEIDGIPYLTMPYIKGKSLSEAIGQDQTITEAQAAAIALKLAQALQEAHDRGIIHRDLKPSNIMFNRRRELIVMDFGLARVVDADDKPITRTGHVLGTALYMAPEQASGDLSAVGPACDVYSLGVILYELLTGRRPFEGPWAVVIGLKSVKNPDPPSAYRSDLSPTLNAICLKAIAKDPKDRYATMAELAQELGAFLKLAPASNPVLTPSGTTRPAENPESLAAQFFAGIVTEEVSSLRSKSSIARPEPEPAEDSSTRPPARGGIIATAGAAAIVLLGIIIYIATDNGRIKIEVNDPKAVVKIDGQVVLIEGLGEPITLRAGEHDYHVKRGNGEFRTKKFVVKRGDNEDLKIVFESVRPKVFKSKKDEPVGKATSDESEKVAMKGDEDEKSNDPPVVEGGQPAKPAMEEGKAAPTEKSKEGVAIAGVEPKEASKSPSKKSATSTKKRAGTANPEVPLDATLFEGNRYKVFREELSWPEARKKCEALGGHLAVVKSEDENSFLLKQASAAGLDSVWLGATDEQVEGQWVWLDGTEMRYENWDALSYQQPNNHAGKGIPENCLLLRVDLGGAWWDTTDATGPPLHTGFVCEWGNEAPRPWVRRRAIKPIPRDVKSFAGKRWKTFPEKLSWHQARIRCEEMGGRLAIIANEEENRFVTALLADEHMDNAYLGATDEAVEGLWVWLDGTQMQFAPWNPNQPTNKGFCPVAEHYLMVEKNGRWNDLSNLSNRSMFGFVCQWD